MEKKKFPFVMNLLGADDEPDGVYVTVTCFRDYAKVMQCPDPVRVDVSDELNEAATTAIQAGSITPWEMYKLLKPKTSFDDYGREELEFPNAETALALISEYVGEENKEKKE